MEIHLTCTGCRSTVGFSHSLSTRVLDRLRICQIQLWLECIVPVTLTTLFLNSPLLSSVTICSRCSQKRYPGPSYPSPALSIRLTYTWYRSNQLSSIHVCYGGTGYNGGGNKGRSSLCEIFALAANGRVGWTGNSGSGTS